MAESFLHRTFGPIVEAAAAVAASCGSNMFTPTRPSSSYSYHPPPSTSPSAASAAAPPGGPSPAHPQSSSHARTLPHNPHAGYHRDSHTPSQSAQSKGSRIYNHGSSANVAAAAASSPLNSPPPSLNNLKSPEAKMRSSSNGAAGIAQGAAIGWENAPLSELRAECARREHQLQVLDSRLRHCFDLGDSDGAGHAAATIASETKALRDLAKLVNDRERKVLEKRTRESIEQTFARELDCIEERRRIVRETKHRMRRALLELRVATNFNPPTAPINRSSPSPGAANSPGSPSPVPPVASATSFASSFSAASSSSSSSSSLPFIDYLSRVRFELGKQQVMLDQQCLRVDGIELRSCSEAAMQMQNEGVTNQQPTHTPDQQQEGVQSQSPTPSQSDSHPPSDELTLYFKQSRKRVVTTLQGVLREAESLEAHIKSAESLIQYLQAEEDERMEEGND